MSKPKTVVELSGPLFDPNVVLRFQDAMSDVITELGDEAIGVEMGFIQAGGFVASGRFLRSVESKVVRERGIGYVKVAPTDVWPEPGRPTRTWMETGRRGDRRTGHESVRLRRGVYAFRKTAQHLNAMNLDQRVWRAIGPVLE